MEDSSLCLTFLYLFVPRSTLWESKEREEIVLSLPKIREWRSTVRDHISTLSKQGPSIEPINCANMSSFTHPNTRCPNALTRSHRRILLLGSCLRSWKVSDVVLLWDTFSLCYCVNVGIFDHVHDIGQFQLVCIYSHGKRSIIFTKSLVTNGVGVTAVYVTDLESNRMLTRSA